MGQIPMSTKLEDKPEKALPHRDETYRYLQAVALIDLGDVQAARQQLEHVIQWGDLRLSRKASRLLAELN